MQKSLVEQFHCSYPARNTVEVNILRGLRYVGHVEGENNLRQRYGQE
jgi:hypothetical protein